MDGLGLVFRPASGLRYDDGAAHARGYKVVFGSDVNSTDNPEVHDAELKTLRRGFVLVLANDQIKEALEEKGPYAWTDKTTV